MRNRRRDGGFTLLEVVVALAIAGLALAALFSGATTGLWSSRVSGDTMEAMSLARSHLAEVGHATPLSPGVRSGDDGRGFNWRLRISALARLPLLQAGADATAGRQLPQIVLFGVAVEESWSTDGGTRQVELASRRVGEMAPTAP